ncbi:hypothetical protein ILUMI_23503 [Ignelater luminosus]|uniref:Uncharacterized protein n=1 Tax=Ignelater luminosus TaxID=2038154 RepID=A0A8K0C8N7_IGNLU|nr:hypothetical protein ILUMI_23503 [Ignelater luminosus]
MLALSVLPGVFIPHAMFKECTKLFSVSGFDVHLIAIVLSSICIFYTAFGGLQAVIWADALQLTVTLLSLSIALIMGIVSVGGLGRVWEKAEAGDRLHFFTLNPDPTIRTTFWNILISRTCGGVVGLLNQILIILQGAVSGGIVSTAFMLFVNIKRQLYIWNGIIRYESKPFSVDGCNKTDLNITSAM